ncbi:efflux RND transporter periplasmic adaptor subunit [Bremerella sp. T1]|uniref:efflux RND transporter periplasmic adaptor subunit n=1 Tax=Bremerella sp. TYQ1 TaxID=3119568 RepID=UPI001CCE5969|nr:efflux RND transporter periplasmic adaptor subunit [Bremerella volcania]UBM36900.1 efflux RND transporter periplasmic adaptor subunit [Bremerella volcania]
MNISSYSPSSESFFGQKWTKRQLWTGRIAIAGVLVAIVALVATWNNPFAAAAPAPTPTAEPLPVEVVTITPQSAYAASRSFTGVLVAAKTSDLSFETPGKVTQLNANEGDRVEAGQVLAVLDDRHLSARILQTEAQRDQQAAVLKELIAGPRPEVIAAAEAEVRQLTAEHQFQEANRKRREQLIQRSAISQETLDDSIYGADAALGRLDAAKSRLAELKEGTRVEQIEAQRARVAGLEAQLVDLRHEQEDTRLVAPFAGVIAQRNMDEGSVVNQGQTVFRIVQDQPLEAWFGLPPEAAATLGVKEERPITVSQQSRLATVTGVVPELDPATRTQTVILTLDAESSQGWVPAQVVRMELATERNADGFWLPNSALLQGSRGLWSVYVVKEDRIIERRAVEVIHSESEQSFVRGTLVAGDQVVARGVNRLVPGMEVEVGATSN